MNQIGRQNGASFAACGDLKVYSTCPMAGAEGGEEFRRRVIEAGRWSDETGCTGMLVYTDNRVIDPWALSHILLQNTRQLTPLLALQPIYMHPFTVAKQIASLSYLYDRRIDLNLVAGGFKTELEALHDSTPHDQRYERLREYMQVVSQLLERSCEGKAVTFHGAHYRIDRVKLTPAMQARHLPRLTISGSSDASRATARALGAVAVCYPQPASQCAPRDPAVSSSGIRVGIVARGESEEAWAAAHARFPGDEKGKLTHALAMKVSDSVWHRQLSDSARGLATEADSPYWLHPFENYSTFCPYLVGSYSQVAAELRRYLVQGDRTLILDIPRERSDLEHAALAVGLACSEPA